ncbi:hypothetical protein ABIA48_005039 [Pseudomonas sp. S30_BP2TU TE3576]
MHSNFTDAADENRIIVGYTRVKGLPGFLERHASPDNFPNQKLARPRIELTHKVNVPGTEGLIAEPGPSDHLEVVHPVDRYEVPVIHWHEMPVVHWYEVPVIHWHEMPVAHWYEMPVVHWYEMPVLHMKRAPVEMLELPALLWLPTDQNGRVRILIETATADCLQGEAACQKPRNQEQELLEDTHSATSDGPPPH